MSFQKKRSTFLESSINPSFSLVKLKLRINTPFLDKKESWSTMISILKITTVFKIKIKSSKRPRSLYKGKLSFWPIESPFPKRRLKKRDLSQAVCKVSQTRPPMMHHKPSSPPKLRNKMFLMNFWKSFNIGFKETNLLFFPFSKEFKEPKKKKQSKRKSIILSS